MKIGDLVRNEVFRKVANESPEEIERIDETNWQPFFQSFDVSGVNHFDKYFFPFGIISDPNLKKSGVFIHLREKWNKISDPVQIIEDLGIYREDLGIYRNAFIDTLTGSNENGFQKNLHTRFKRLSKMNAPGSILPFTMRLGREVSIGNIPEDDAACVLDCIEDFLVRRAICGHEPTGLHAVFKRLWLDCDGDITAASVANAIAAHKTVAWPKNDEFERAIYSRELYGSKITPYFLIQFDESLGGDAFEHVETVEHVLPQKAKNTWATDYGTDHVHSDTHTLPNLLPCSVKMNSSLGNQSYQVKKQRFQSDSKFKSVRDFGNNFSDWNHDNFERRAELLSNWALNRWPTEKPS